jgi:8-oxo-dGTP pyrophosphatase MutT (NUDIX family)
MSEITTTSSRMVYENRWMKVHEDQIAYPDGTPGLYGWVQKPDFALVVPASDTGFHLVEQYRYPVKGRYWEFPQGSWEENPDADPAELARGELAEETGLRAENLRRLGVVHESYGLSGQRGHVFLATGLTAGPTNLSLEEGDLVCQHIPFEEFPKLVAAGRITDACSLAAYALLMLDAEWSAEHPRPHAQTGSA